VAGGPLFVAVVLINDQIKDDYDPVRDFVSEAASGPGGWVQIVAFLVTGGLTTAFSVAVRRVVSRWTGWLVGAFGAGLALAGVFVGDGARTWHGVVHDVVAVVAFAALTAAAFTAARWEPTAAWRCYCRAVGVAVPVLFVLSAVPAATGVFQRLTIAAGCTWLAVLGLRALRATAAAGPPAPRRVRS
jgi:hypothetical membrane protein